MTNKNKARGSGFETRFVARAKKRGLTAHRQPGSGQFKDHPNDAVVDGILFECKMRTDHPSVAQMMEWLRGVEANAVRGEFLGGMLVYNHKGSRKPIVVMDMERFFDLLVEARLANM